jgi:hypothetical protein
MSDGSNRPNPRTSVRLPDPVERLIEAWTTWDRVAARTPKYPTGHWLTHEAAALVDAINALGLNGIHLRRLVAAHRRRTVAGHPEGLSIPDAIQCAVNEMAPNDDLMEGS